MHLTRYTDYALRVLLFAAATEETVTISRISEAFGISREHLRKVVHTLARLGYLDTTQGRRGGLVLGRPANRINVGEVIGALESMELLECFNKETNRCPILGVCGLTHALAKAQRSFMDVLSGYTLSDLVANPKLALFVRDSAR
ncbi:MAG: RrF2 family transcriptional regulator [Pseudohongiellaceae bacterium]|jgi:Rrf2 family nitric oxide-sensitive transcriptional repressor